MDAADRAMLAGSVAGSVRADAAPGENDAALEALGWAEMLATEPVTAAGVVFEQLGRAAATSNALDDVVATSLGLPVGTTVVHPAWGALRPPSADGDGDSDGTIGERGRDAEVAHVVTADAVLVVDRAALELRSDHPDATFARITVARSPVARLDRAPDEVTAAVTAARRVIAQQLNGLAAGMLELARTHAIERVQFGRPIASFQAVRHKLAETLVAVDAAADALDACENGSPLAVDLARVLAGRAAREAARHGQQVLAGIGFTREHPFHQHLFAVLELDGIYGTTEGLTRELGRHLLSTRDVPRVVEL